MGGYKTGRANDPEEEEEEENSEGNHKQPATNPIGGSRGWENGNEPMSAPRTLGIHGGRAGRFTKQATTLLEEGNKQNSGIKARALHRVLMGENPILQNKIGGGNESRGGTGTMVSLTAGQQQCAGGR